MLMCKWKCLLMRKALSAGSQPGIDWKMPFLSNFHLGEMKFKIINIQILQNGGERRKKCFWRRAKEKIAWERDT